VAPPAAGLAAEVAAFPRAAAWPPIPTMALPED